MKVNGDGFSFAALLFVVLLLVGGWIANLCRFVNCDFEQPLKAEVIRGIGVFVPPVGAIAGYIDIDDTPSN